MPVTDLQVACLKALLTHDYEEHERLIGQLGDQGMRNGYFPLLTSAFLDGATQRFRGQKRSDIVRWVAEKRAQRPDKEQLDPNVAELLLLWAFGKASLDEVDAMTSDGHQTLLLGLLVEEREFDDAQLNAFLQAAREDTDKALSSRETE